MTKLRSRVPGGLRLRPKQDAPDVALAWDEVAGSRLVAVSRSPTVVVGVIWATDGPPAAAHRMRQALLAADGLFCLSEAQQARLSEWVGSGGPPVHVVRFGVDTDYYAAQPYPERPLVLSVGNDRHRDVPLTLRSLAAVHRARPGVRCVLVSARPLDVAVPPEVELLIDQPHSAVRDLLRDASVVTVATRPNWHVSGMTVALEAMSVGRPVVMTRSPGAEEYLVPETGTLVPQGDEQELTSAVLRWLDDPAEAAAAGARGRAVVEVSRTTATLCTSLLETIRSVAR
jgi:glycosyltransferase involved in cell wall biosynthesis